VRSTAQMTAENAAVLPFQMGLPALDAFPSKLVVAARNPARTPLCRSGDERSGPNGICAIAFRNHFLPGGVPRNSLFGRAGHHHFPVSKAHWA